VLDKLGWEIFPIKSFGSIYIDQSPIMNEVSNNIHKWKPDKWWVLTRVVTSLFFFAGQIGSGRPPLALEHFPKKFQILIFLPSGQKYSIGSGQKVKPGFAPYSLQVRSMFGLGWVRTHLSTTNFSHKIYINQWQ